MSEYIDFRLIEEKPKTSVYSVVNLTTETSLGSIKWYGPWRQYCFFPIPHNIFNKDCMQYIIEFINKLMEERKK